MERQRDRERVVEQVRRVHMQQILIHLADAFIQKNPSCSEEDEDDDDDDDDDAAGG